MRTFVEGLAILGIICFYIAAFSLLGLSIGNATYDPIASTHYSFYYDSNVSLRGYLRMNGWVDNRVTADDLEYIILLAEQLSSMTDHVDPALAIAMIAQESRFYSDCEYKGAVGLMQLLPNYHQDKLNHICEEKPSFDKWYEPRYNIMVGMMYMDELLGEDYANGDTVYALMMYNQGPVSASKTYLGSGITSDYAKAILELRNNVDEILKKGEGWNAEAS